MADEKVRQVQEWLNATYGGNGQWRTLSVDGQIGWLTVFGLIRGLQIELGITSLSDSFGDGTFSRLSTQFPFIMSTTPNANVKRLAQSAMWCQGYIGGYTWGTYDAVMNEGLKTFSANVGLTAPGEPVSNVFTPKMVKALMTLDSYTLLPGASAEIRESQRWLNGKYRSRKMPFLPCDGIFTRSTQQGLVTAVQYEIGLTDTQANGYFGDGTKSGLAANAVVGPGATDSAKNWVRLLQSALRMNGYKEAPLTGTFDSATTQSVQKFKSFAELGSSATADFATWASLLISTGDEMRKGVASDMSKPLSAAYCTALAAKGYKTVGRYLSVSGKRYQWGELDRIFAAGLSTFPIMQEDNTYAEYFDLGRGLDHGLQAIKRLRQLGFKGGNTVFFAVDFDALDDTITSRVIPYFRGIAVQMSNSTVKYKVGVYGTRNVCARIVKEGLAEESFVASMSWGWGGNLGYPLPAAWSYDQIRNHTLSGTDLEIDTNVQSVRARPATASDVLPSAPAQIMTPYPHENYDEDYYWYLVELIVRAERVTAASGAAGWGQRANKFALLYLANLKYDDWQFWAYANHNLQGSEESAVFESFRNDMTKPPESTLGRLSHMAAAVRGLRQHGVPNGSTYAAMGDFGGWGFDLAQAWGDTRDAGAADDARNWIRRNVSNDSTHFGLEDFVADVDAYHIGNEMAADPNISLSEVVRRIELNAKADPKWRYRKFVNDRFGNDHSKAAQSGASVFNTPLIGIIAAELSKGPAPTPDQANQVGLGFADVLWSRAGL